MIGKQANFYLTSTDQLHLLELINRNVGCVLIKRDDDRSYHASMKYEKKETDWAIAYLCAPSFTEQVLDAIQSGEYDSSMLLAIEFIQSVEEDGIIRRGRLWYSPMCLSAGELVQKQKSFIDWANSVLRNVKRELAPYGNGDWIGSEAGSRFEG